MHSLPSIAAAQLLLRLRPLNRALRLAVENQQAAAAQLARPDLSSLCVTDEQSKILLEQVDKIQNEKATPSISVTLSSEECAVENELRACAAKIGASLPLDQLSNAIGLTAFEQEALLLCAAPELDRAYERIFAFILDDLNRRFPCIELLISLTSTSIQEQLIRRQALSSYGKLRRYGVLVPFGIPQTDLRQEFRLASGIFEFLTGNVADMSRLCRDRFEVAVAEGVETPSNVDPKHFASLVKAILKGNTPTIGIWGPRHNGTDELVLALAAAARRSLRRLSILELEQSGVDPAQTLRDQILVASGLGSLFWLDIGRFGESLSERLQQLLADAFVNCPVPSFITSEHPWRPADILSSDGYVELELSEPMAHERKKIWSQSFPELDQVQIDDLASRFCLGSADIHSVSKIARTRAHIAGNGQAEPVRDHVGAACFVVTRRSTCNFTTTVTPKRGPGDLVLRPDLHRQVVEVAEFFRLRQRVDDDWGFGRLSGGSGMKALFTGEPGTGKTLAAEVIAGLIGVLLLKVDLARVVSKWVGETEKNLESAFREAEDTHSVLFFDEAEALFGKRAEVQHGTDRYANLEVSYLLQRLENSRGLVILASNVKDQIDSAFSRRFQVVIHFPKPTMLERRRIWELVFPQSAPVAEGVDLDALARLDMTGAAIVSAARSAAFLAARAGSSVISMTDAVRATARQFRREARVLTPSDLGLYGALLQGPS